jgi:hypothetical protein
MTKMSESGIFVPSLFVFSWARLKPQLFNVTPPRRVAASHPSEWIETDISTQWFEHFIKMVTLKMDRTVLLIPDGQFSRTANLDAIARG